MYKEIEGNLISMALKGAFDVIAHGCNCHSVMGAGIAPQMAKAFGADKFPMELWGSDVNKLGCIDFKTFVLGKNAMWCIEDGDGGNPNEDNEPELTVVNAYTQYGFGSNHRNGKSKPIDYEALTLCMRKMNHIFKGSHIGLPLIGCGLAGGVWDVNDLPHYTAVLFKVRDVKTIIQQELKDCDVTIVKLPEVNK